MEYRRGVQQSNRSKVSNISDEDYLGIKTTLALFTPLLRPTGITPRATILTLFLDMTQGQANQHTARRAMMLARPYLPKPTPNTLDYEPHPHAMLFARRYFRDSRGTSPTTLSLVMSRVSPKRLKYT